MVTSYVKAVSLAVAICLPSVAIHEGLETTPYTDLVGVRTVCYGETVGVEEREYTESECLVRLANRVAKDYEAPIKRCTSTWNELPLEAQSAAISLSYNIGTGAFCKSSVHRYFEKREFRIGCEKIKLWDKGRVNGRLKKIKGLTNRRNAEAALCLEGVERHKLG